MVAETTLKIDNRLLLTYLKNTRRTWLGTGIGWRASTYQIASRRFGKSCSGPFAGADRLRGHLLRWIQATERIDWLLYLTQKEYRDHSDHQRSVAMLGDLLLQVKVNGTQTLAQRSTHCGDPAVALDSTEEVELAWWLAALLHDHAYPLAHMLKSFPAASGSPRSWWNALHHLLKKHFSRVFRCEVIEDLWKCLPGEDRRRNAREVLHQWLAEGDRAHIPDPEFAVFAPRHGPRRHLVWEHGLWSAANICMMMGYFGYTGQDDGMRRILRAAVRAAALHSADCAVPIEFDRDPIAFLLLLCDELHEWGRLRVGAQDGEPESNSVRIGLRWSPDTAPGSWEFDDVLDVEFNFPNWEPAHKISWDLGEFQYWKSLALKRLRVPDGDFKPRTIRFHVCVPTCVRLRTQQVSRR